jgi:hypothetical protein
LEPELYSSINSGEESRKKEVGPENQLKPKQE